MLKKNTAPKKEGHIKHKRLYAGKGLHIKRKRGAYASLPFYTVSGQISESGMFSSTFPEPLPSLIMPTQRAPIIIDIPAITIIM